MRKFKYVVSISYHEFEFDNMTTASAFTELAAKHIVKDGSSIYIEVVEEVENMEITEDEEA